MHFMRGQKLVMIGDSITDCGRAQPVAEGLFDPLGRGYVNLVSALIGATNPELQLRIVNVGCSGHTVRDLTNRWERDVFNLKPDWVSVMIGINDVWRQFDSPLQKEIHVLPEEYEEKYDKLVAQTRPKVRGMLLATPYYIDLNKADPMRQRMEQYAGIVRKLAGKYDCLLCDVQAAFDQVLEHHHPMYLAWDRIHPNQIGHMVIAKAFLKAWGFAW